MSTEASMAARWADYSVAWMDNLMAVLLVVMTVALLAGMLVVHWVDLRVASMDMTLVDKMDACSAVHSAAHLVASMANQWVARLADYSVAWWDTSSAMMQVI